MILPIGRGREHVRQLPTYIQEWLGQCKKEIDDYENLNHAGAEKFGQHAKIDLPV